MFTAYFSRTPHSFKSLMCHPYRFQVHTKVLRLQRCRLHKSWKMLQTAFTARQSFSTLGFLSCKLWLMSRSILPSTMAFSLPGLLRIWTGCRGSWCTHHSCSYHSCGLRSRKPKRRLSPGPHGPCWYRWGTPFGPADRDRPPFYRRPRDPTRQSKRRYAAIWHQ